MVSISNGYGLRPGVRPDRLLRARPEHYSRRILRTGFPFPCGAVAGLSGPSVGALQRPHHCQILSSFSPGAALTAFFRSL